MKLIISIALTLLFFTACSSLNMANLEKQNTPKKEKLISQANSGNIKAMVELNKYYLYPETKEGFDYYNRWYETVLNSKNPKDILLFSEIFSKYRDMFINGESKNLALLKAAAKYENKEAMLELIKYYNRNYKYEELKKAEEKYLKKANDEDILELYDYYLNSYRTKKAQNMLKSLKESKLLNTKVERLLNFKYNIYKKNRGEVKKVAPEILQYTNQKIILDCAYFLNKKYMDNLAIKFYERAIELGNDDINTYNALIRLYRRDINSKDKKSMKKLIDLSQKAALKDDYDATKNLFNLYKRYPDYAKDYKSIKSKILKLNESKRALADFYHYNSRIGKANDLLDELAKKGNIKAIVTLATRSTYYYSYDIEEKELTNKWKEYILNSNNKKLLALYNKKANKRALQKDEKEIDTNNIITLRELYRDNRYRHKDLAKKYLEKAAKLGDAYSLYKLARYYSKSANKEDREKSLEIYKSLVEKGAISASTRLADVYFEKARDSKKMAPMNKALSYLEKASSLGDKYSTKRLAKLYLCGECQKEGFDLIDYKKAKFYLEKLEKDGDKSAIFSIGWLYNNGYGVKKDIKKAEEYYLKSANLGFSTGYYNAAWMYYKGENKDYKKALKFLKMGEKVNQDDCINLLGIFYENGYGVKKDMQKAVSYYKRASRYNSYASFNLGKYYRNQKKYKEALDYFKLSNKQGNDNATNELGVMYEKGFGVKKDINKALEYYQTAYVQEKNKTAAYNIGLIYHYGKGGIKKDMKLAKEWYNLSNTKDAKEKLKTLK